MKRGSTMFLRAVVCLLGLIVLTICVFALPRAISDEVAGDFDYGFIFIGMYVAAVPFFLALYQAMKLLNHIDKNKAFSLQSVKALGNIKYCAFVISALYILGMPYVFYVADRDDAPGVAALGFIIIGVSFVIGVGAAVLQRLIRYAVAIKSENDLTV